MIPYQSYLNRAEPEIGEVGAGGGSGAEDTDGTVGARKGDAEGGVDGWGGSPHEPGVCACNLGEATKCWPAKVRVMSPPEKTTRSPFVTVAVNLPFAI